MSNRATAVPTDNRQVSVAKLRRYKFHTRLCVLSGSQSESESESEVNGYGDYSAATERPRETATIHECYVYEVILIITQFIYEY